MMGREFSCGSRVTKYGKEPRRLVISLHVTTTRLWANCLWHIMLHSCLDSVVYVACPFTPHNRSYINCRSVSEPGVSVTQGIPPFVPGLLGDCSISTRAGTAVD